MHMTPEDKAKLIESDLKAADKARKDAQENEMKENEKAKADAEEMRGNMDKMLSCFDSLSKRFDAMESGMNDKAKKDAEEAGPEGKEIKEKGDPKELTADSARADSAAVINELCAIQWDADRADSAWSKTAPAPWSHEMPDAYRRRLASGHQRHSDAWKDCDLHDLKGAALRNATKQIFADSIVASKNLEAIGRMNLREVRRVTDSGHVVKEYFGDPLAWMSQFAGGRSLARFNFPRNKD
jgi:hypothetical protein